MKAFLILILSSQIFSVPASAQTVFRKAPLEDLMSQYEGANPASVDDFPDSASGEIMTCHYWDPAGNKFGLFGDVVRLTKTWSEGGYKGVGPLYPDSPGEKKSSTGLAFKDTVINSGPENLTLSKTDSIWNFSGANHLYFRKRDEYIFFKHDWKDGGYGYCWKEKKVD